MQSGSFALFANTYYTQCPASGYYLLRLPKIIEKQMTIQDHQIEALEEAGVTQDARCTMF